MLVLQDKNVSEMFNEDIEALSDKHFDNEKVSKKSLTRLIVQECCNNMRKTINDSKNKNGIRYSSLLLRYATLINMVCELLVLLTILFTKMEWIRN